MYIHTYIYTYYLYTNIYRNSDQKKQKKKDFCYNFIKYTRIHSSKLKSIHYTFVFDIKVL